MKRCLKGCLKKCIRVIYCFMVKLLPVNQKVIVFNSNVGRNYTGNPRALYEAMRSDERFNDYKKIWFFNREYLKSETYKRYCNGILSDNNSRVIKYGFLKYHYYMAIAGIWIFDGRQEEYLVKRDKVTYLQCWHGTPLKKLALDMENLYMAEEEDIENYKERFLKESASWDLLISQNPFSTETFRRCFGYKGKILETGYPRNDILRKCMDRSEELRVKYNIPDNKKVILYAPTWRDNRSNDDGSYCFVSELDYRALGEKLKEEYIFIIKEHYLVRNKVEPKGDFIKVFGADTDISELYLISDIMVTDYSSVMFDYAVLNKPMIFYMFDLEDYRDRLRGFYFDILAEAPGTVTRSTGELIDAVKKTGKSAGKKTGKETGKVADSSCPDQLYIDKFKDRYAPYDDGYASQRVLEGLYNSIDSGGNV